MNSYVWHDFSFTFHVVEVVMLYNVRHNIYIYTIYIYMYIHTFVQYLFKVQLVIVPFFESLCVYVLVGILARRNFKMKFKVFAMHSQIPMEDPCHQTFFRLISAWIFQFGC